MDLYLETLALGVCWLGMGRMNPKATTKVVEGMQFVILLSFCHPKGNQLRHDSKGFKYKPDTKRKPALLAPSAVNSQPWHFTHEGDILHVYCNQRYSRPDIDITLVHFHVANEEMFKFFKADSITDLPGYTYIGSANLLRRNCYGIQTASPRK